MTTTVCVSVIDTELVSWVRLLEVEREVARCFIDWRMSEVIPIPNSVHLLDVKVAPSRRHQGLGTRLLQQVEGLVRKSDQWHWITLGVEPRNEVAIGLYQKLGYIFLPYPDYETDDYPIVRPMGKCLSSSFLLTSTQLPHA